MTTNYSTKRRVSRWRAAAILFFIAGQKGEDVGGLPGGDPSIFVDHLAALNHIALA